MVDRRREHHQPARDDRGLSLRSSGNRRECRGHRGRSARKSPTDDRWGCRCVHPATGREYRGHRGRSLGLSLLRPPARTLPSKHDDDDDSSCFGVCERIAPALSPIHAGATPKDPKGGVVPAAIEVPTGKKVSCLARLFPTVTPERNARKDPKRCPPWTAPQPATNCVETRNCSLGAFPESIKGRTHRTIGRYPPPP